MHHLQSIIATAFLLHLFIFSKAQETAVTGWLMLSNTIKTKGPFTVYFDGQFRTNDRLKHAQTIILRPGLSYTVKKNITATVGYAWVQHRRVIGEVSGYAPEHRLWEQLQVSHPVAFTTLNHRFRLEQRFITKSQLDNNTLRNQGNSYANRFRYFFRDIIPFSGKERFNKGVFASLQNELFVNIGDKSTVNGKFFDQNRAYAALGYRFSQKLDVEAGYLNQYVWGRNETFSNGHNIQIAFYTRL